MGSGSYTASDWARLKKSRNIDGASVNVLFKAEKMEDRFNPLFIDKREARDSQEHPHSTPIAIGVDVTGSMGYLSSEIIHNSLNELMKKLYSTNLVEDPQLMFAAIGDASVDEAPLQVTQFESDIRIAEQLMDLWLESSGGDSPEDYQLLWYFLDRHAETDCYSKRKKKGFCFTIGDADFHEVLKKRDIKRIFGDDTQDFTSKQLAELALEKYEVFHIDLGTGTECASKLIPGRVLTLKSSNVKFLPEVIIAAMQLTNGVSRKEILGPLDFTTKGVVENAIRRLSVGKNIKL